MIFGISPSFRMPSRSGSNDNLVSRQVMEHLPSCINGTLKVAALTVAATMPSRLMSATCVALGLIMMVREQWPEMPIHLSVQANAVNYASVKFWQRMGLTRVILSRELSLDEIAEIRQECPDMEIEVFVHGALCIAYSGRCLLSGYLNKRDANQGSCTNACRWNYATQGTATDPNTGEREPDGEGA